MLWPVKKLPKSLAYACQNALRHNCLAAALAVRQQNVSKFNPES